MRRPVRLVAAVLGTAAVGLGLAVGLWPGTVAGLPGGRTLTGLLAGTRATTVMLLGGILAVALGLLAARGPGGRTVLRGPTPAGERFDAAAEVGDRTDRPPEAAVGAATRVVGERFDRRVAAALDGDEAALAAVRASLRERVVAALTTAGEDGQEGAAREAAAREAVAAGTWTDDRVVAAFLGAADGPDGPADGWRQVRPRGPSTRERIERTVAALEGIQEEPP